MSNCNLQGILNALTFINHIQGVIMYVEIWNIFKCLCNIGILIIIITYLHMQNRNIEIEYFDIKLDNMMMNQRGLKIAHISDVHLPNNSFNTEKLKAILKNERPDIIVITGDLIYKHKKIDEIELGRFCNSLSSISKTYAVTGNHETWSGSLEQWNKVLNSNKVIVLDNKIEIFSQNKCELAIVGLKEGCHYTEELFRGMGVESNIPKLLLSHRPERFIEYYSSPTGIRPDLVLSGHAHGGQFRIPFFNKSVYSPEQGIFPKYSSGLYYSDNGVQMIVSRGLGNSVFPIRINNRIHLPIINLK